MSKVRFQTFRLHQLHNLHTFKALITSFFFKLGNIETPEVIEARLKYILSKQTNKAEYPIAVLTTENRDTWAKVRSDLVSDGNSEALKTIDSAIFVISLEDGQFDEANPNPLFKQLLGGCGYSRYKVYSH